MKFIKKTIAFILLVIVSITSIVMRISSYFIIRISPLASIIAFIIAGYRLLTNGFIVNKILPVVVIGLLIGFIGTIVVPRIVRIMRNTQKDIHDYVFSVGRYKEELEIDYTTDATCRKLMLNRLD